LTQSPIFNELLDSAGLHSEFERFSRDAVLLTMSVDCAGAKQWTRVHPTEPEGLPANEIVESMKGPSKPAVRSEADGSPLRRQWHRVTESVRR